MWHWRMREYSCSVCCITIFLRKIVTNSQRVAYNERMDSYKATGASCTIYIASTDDLLPAKCRRILWAKEFSVDIDLNGEDSVQFIRLKEIYTLGSRHPRQLIQNVFKDLWREGIELYLAHFEIHGNQWSAELEENGGYKELYTFKLIGDRKSNEITKRILLP